MKHSLLALTLLLLPLAVGCGGGEAPNNTRVPDVEPVVPEGAEMGADSNAVGG